MAFLPIPDFPALLDVLDQRRIRFDLDDEGRVRIRAPAGAMCPEIRMQIRRYRQQLIWTVIARGTGHVWAPCNQCGQAVLLDPKARQAGKTVWPSCRLTPGCKGRHTTDGSTGPASFWESEGPLRPPPSSYTRSDGCPDGSS